MQPKTLIFDIETSLAIYAAYPSNKPQFLSHHNMIKDWFMICFSWHWEDHSKSHVYSLLDDMPRFQKDPSDDYAVVSKLHDIISDADAIVGHNMQRFDWKKFMSRVIYHKLPPLPQPKIIDTLKEAKRCAFSHNSLSHLTKHLNIELKDSHSPDMWMRIIQGDKEAVKECVKYCRQDVIATTELYKRLKPYMPSTALPNANLWRGDGVECCVACGSTDIINRGFRLRNSGKYKAYTCNCCGKWMQGKKNYKTVGIK